MDRVTQGRAKANQQGAFGRSGLDLFWVSRPENGVLCFEIGNLAEQDGLRHLDEENKEGVLANFGHREKGQKAWSFRPIFDMQISTLEKREFTEGNLGWINIFAWGLNRAETAPVGGGEWMAGLWGRD
jgi:hypothetical protein